MSHSQTQKFRCDNGHVFEPSIFGVAECPTCGSTNFWPDGKKKKTKVWIIASIGLLGVIGAGAGAAWHFGLFPESWFTNTGEVFLMAEQDPNDPCTFFLNVKQLPDSTDVAETWFRYSMARGPFTSTREYCWSEGGNATFRASRRTYDKYNWKDGDSTVTLITPGSTKLDECDCYGITDPAPSTDLCGVCGFDPNDPSFSIAEAPVECQGNTAVFAMGFDRKACAECNRDWYTRIGNGPWTQDRALPATDATVYNLYATYGTSAEENQPVPFFENGNAIELVDCSPKSNLPSRSDIESDLPGRFNGLSRNQSNESVENFTIPGKGRVIIPPGRVEFKLNNRPASYRQFQNDIMMLGKTVKRVVVSETKNAGYATEVVKLEVTLQ